MIITQAKWVSLVASFLCFAASADACELLPPEYFLENSKVVVVGEVTSVSLPNLEQSSELFRIEMRVDYVLKGDAPKHITILERRDYGCRGVLFPSQGYYRAMLNPAGGNSFTAQSGALLGNLEPDFDGSEFGLEARPVG